MLIHVMGPNLRGTDMPYHVHISGCADVQRDRMYAGRDHASDRATSYDFADLGEVAEFLFGEVEDNPRELVGDIKVFPCAAALPRGV
jgi:hypothetical protein